MTVETPYEQLGGDAGIRRLAEAFYQAMDTLPEAATIRAMHGEHLENITEKLYQYLSGWLGGPHLYAEKYGTVCMSTPHKPYAIGTEERDQWLQCMEIALDKVGASEELRTMLQQPFRGIAEAVQNSD